MKANIRSISGAALMLVIIPIIAGASPHAAVFIIKVDGGNRAVGAFHRLYLVSHRPQLRANPFRHLVCDPDASRLGFMCAEGTLHLEAGDVVRLGGLLHVHAELHHVQVDLQDSRLGQR